MWPNLPNWINIIQMSSIKAFLWRLFISITIWRCSNLMFFKNNYWKSIQRMMPMMRLSYIWSLIASTSFPNCNFQKTEQSGIWINYLSVVLTIAAVLLVFHCQNCKDLQSSRTPLSIICSRHIFGCCRCCNPPPSRFFIVPFKIPKI